MSALSRQDERYLEKAARAAFKGVRGDLDIHHLADPVRTFVTVYAVQPVIDNGGFQYVFERDWPGCPPYTEFSRAYRGIGATDVAQWLDAAAGLFPFPEPHLHRDARVTFLRAHCVKSDTPMGQLSWQAIEASDQVFARLAAYARAHPSSFGHP